MNSQQFLKLVKTFSYRDNYESEDVYTYPDGGSIYVRLNPRGAPDCYDIVATGEAIPFAKACLGDTKLKDAKAYPRWRIQK